MPYWASPCLQEHRGLLAIHYPMEHGVVQDWNDMERIWQYVYSKDQLQTFSEEVWPQPCQYLAPPWSLSLPTTSLCPCPPPQPGVARAHPPLEGDRMAGRGPGLGGEPSGPACAHATPVLCPPAPSSPDRGPTEPQQEPREGRGGVLRDV